MAHDIAFVREQGMNLVVVCVADHILDSPSQREQTWKAFERQYGLPTAILGANRHRVYGDKRIVGWLSSIDPARLPWRRAA
ncbi:hypothetical protein OICFNHDK_0181 [Methylobacterium bullatum]|uniref:Uncharacterized protein n=1 Tax=Methylobacterium bullatum TaxID=570505 RepID=A0AAV4Z179_9HYPH|nr:hypothetical protein OICFNHDK_0181 [Methylobacterium bullatum]